MRRLLLLSLVLAGSVTEWLETPSFAGEPPVDVRIAERPEPRRVVSLEYNPLPLIVGKISANVLVVPIEHHALVLSPFYATITTQPIWVYDDQGNPTQLPKQTFSGFGAEIGYRYYLGRNGPRGFFAGPSAVIAAMTAKAQNGDTTNYIDYGVAVDVGYELLVADRVALTFGAGGQYTGPSRSMPDQQFPADIYANRRLLPRVLFALGCAL